MTNESSSMHTVRTLYCPCILGRTLGSSEDERDGAVIPSVERDTGKAVALITGTYKRMKMTKDFVRRSCVLLYRHKRADEDYPVSYLEFVSNQNSCTNATPNVDLSRVFLLIANLLLI
ncbi:hypothetical protein ACJX0J_013680 [Zea mays]